MLCRKAAKAAIKNALTRLVLGFAHKVLKLDMAVMDMSTPYTLKRIRHLCENVSTIIDVGASTGIWTAQACSLFPDAKMLLVEANPVHELYLQNFVRSHTGAEYELCAASDKDGFVYFSDEDAFGGLASHDAGAGVQVPACTLDTLVQKHALSGSYLLKLDTHGFEVPILQGAVNLLKNTSLVVIETYNFHLCPGALTFWEMCEYMRKLGFLPLGISEPMYRKHDGAFWQMDIIFSPSARPCFTHHAYE